MNKIESNNLSKSFFIDGVEIKVLNKINLSIKRGDLVALSGKSGAGKSTLLQIAGLLDTPKSGKIKSGFTEYLASLPPCPVFTKTVFNLAFLPANISEVESPINHDVLLFICNS